MRLTKGSVLVALGALAFAVQAVAEPPAASDALARTVLDLAGIRVGVCEMPRIGDGTLAVSLAKAGATLVHGLAPDGAAADAARTNAVAAGMLGVRVMIEQGSPGALPLADWLADLVVVADATDANLRDIPPSEVWRVLSPYRGTAVIGNAVGGKGGLGRVALETWARQVDGGAKVNEGAKGLWAVIRKPGGSGMDEWTHFGHGSGNNPVSSDTVFELPPLVQYMTAPFVGAGGSARFAGGRLFELQGQQHKHGPSVGIKSRIWCRNAYNGQILWEMALPTNVDAKQISAVATADAFFLLDDDRPGVRVIAPENGALLRTLSLGGEGEQCKWLAVESNRVYALVGRLAPPYPPNATYHGLPEKFYADMRSQKLNHGLRVTAYDLAAERVLWSHSVEPDRIDPRAIAAWDGRIVFLVEDAAHALEGSDEKVTGQRLVCLDGATGAPLWENRDPRLGSLRRRYQYIFGREYHPGLIATSEALRLRLLGIYDNDILFFDPATGGTRWALLTRDAASKRDIPGGFEGFIRGGQYLHAKRAYDVQTGKLLRSDVTWDGGCGVRTASPAGVFGNFSGGSVDMAVKSDCHMGSFVAGGLLNVMRGWCSCNGVWNHSLAFAPRRGLDVEAPVGAGRLNAGAALADPPGLPALDAADWPVYRHDNERTAATPVGVPERVRLLWHRAPDIPYEFESVCNLDVMRRQDQPTEPVAAGGLVFVGGSDGRVEALRAADGSRVWRHWAGGRLHSPPTVWEGRLYIGAADGHVTCLDAATGALRWRFRAAPHDQRILEAMHLVSRWPVLTGVLVHGDTAYFAAGRVDIQGVHVYALDARTGALRWHDPAVGRDRERTPGITPDGFLAVMGSRLYLRSREGLVGRFALETGAQAPLPDYPNPRGRMGWDGFGPTGREIAVLGDGFVLEGGRKIEHELNQHSGDRGHPSFRLKRFGPEGEVLSRVSIRLSEQSILPPAFDRDALALVPGGWSRHTVDGKRMDSSPGPGGTMGLLLLDTASVLSQARQVQETHGAFDSIYEPVQTAALDGRKLSREEDVGEYDAMYRTLPAFRWQFEDRLVQVGAVALASNAVVFTRGYLAKDERGRPAGQFERWTLVACRRADGAILWQVDLPGEPILNGLCIDRDGRAIVTLRDGGAAACGE